jgi:hypothetical protein
MASLFNNLEEIDPFNDFYDSEIERLDLMWGGYSDSEDSEGYPSDTDKEDPFNGPDSEDPKPSPTPSLATSQPTSHTTS